MDCVKPEQFLARMDPTAEFRVFTDGACKGNPGPGGWGAVLLQGDLQLNLSGPAKETTNNRMELTAAIEALAFLPVGAHVHLTTDSQYVKNGIEGWIRGWKNNGWVTSQKTPVKNVELWKRLDELRNSRNVTWAWVKGHDTNVYNNLADELAVRATPSKIPASERSAEVVEAPSVAYGDTKKIDVSEFVAKLNKSLTVKAWTDGACSRNPGPGGWGVVLQQGELACELNGGDRQTTNNRMELTAAIVALEKVPEGFTVELTTDSQYVRDGVTKWMIGWKRNGWKTKDGGSVKNQDLWKQLDSARSKHSVRWDWVKGHNGDEHNERADRLAVAGISMA